MTIEVNKKLIKKILMKNYKKISSIIFSILGIIIQKELAKYCNLGPIMLEGHDGGVVIKMYFFKQRVLNMSIKNYFYDLGIRIN